MAKTWMFDPQSGGVKVPQSTQRDTERRIREYAAKHYAGKFTRIEVRFRGALCYVDAFQEPPEPDAELLAMRGETRDQYFEQMRNCPIHLVRLRHFDKDRWSVAFFAYSSDKYEPSLLHSGQWFGMPEECFEIGAGYLMG